MTVAFYRALLLIILMTFSRHSFAEVQHPSVLEGQGCSEACTKPNVTENDVDLEALLKRFGSSVSTNQTLKETPELFILVSLSMPEQSLKLWSEQANKLGATLTLRGFVENSIQNTVATAQHLFGDSKSGGFSVDPERFTEFQVKTVPAVVIAKSSSKNSADVEVNREFDIVYGDISLEEALQTLARMGSIDTQTIAKDYLRQYREASHE